MNKCTVSYSQRKKCTEAKENACDLNDCSARDKVVECLEHAVASLASLCHKDIDIVKDNLSKNHDELLQSRIKLVNRTRLLDRS